ncbi:helix-turn-helix transcriptional regulator [Paraburkholderia youngii]|uniref:Helix-turn-helix transcriptional regulator n=1 Tax=Paraburkholderia youngii TaxID=2782701 RepID=A0A7Y6K8Y3_9BURK|nr:helix-turn-helix transcriptional regulator [Paraburkholderia youngii]NUY06096.1 helix-turn-helix transcriptional regulator [Paraburkholderia youngii]
MQSSLPAFGAAKHYPVMLRPFVGTGSAYPLENVDRWSGYLSPRSGLFVSDDTAVRSPRRRPRADIRTAKEHLENVRAVLNPAIGDLAVLFDVSRQAIYKWLSEESMPDADRLARIRTLSQIADAFKAAGVARAPSLLKMKAFEDRSLFDILKAGEDSSAAVQTLIEEARAMERSYALSGLSNTAAPATADWQSDVSIPGAAEDR